MGPGEHGPHQGGGFWNGLAHIGWALLAIFALMLVAGIFATFDAGQWAAGGVGAGIVLVAVAFGVR